ncbi:MAG TPA: GNVR domain-containing protein [Bacteroidales bacterium]|jgi:uncharacterized protein involved in exopolysaccharide biosynthesis|nr:GNVR domain-containing protein [Bacteroidales bacterium]
MSAVEQNNNKNFRDKDIDLVKLVIVIWGSRRSILISTVIFALIGLLIALFTPKEYTTKVVMIPQTIDNQSRVGNLAGLAAMAGINFSMANASDIPPSVYPQIVSSVPYHMELMKSFISLSNVDHPITLYEYFSVYFKPNPLLKYTIGLPGVLRRALKKNSGITSEGKDTSVIWLTEDQKRVRERLKKSINIDFNSKDGYVTLTCRLPEAIASAQLAQQAQQILQRRIIEFKSEKAGANLEFIQQRYDEIQSHYFETQERLAIFRDRNQNISTAIVETELEKLTNNFNLAFTLYNEMARQLEEAKIQVKEDTPVFTIIEPASVPLEKSKPKRMVILVFWTFLGGILGICIVLAKKFFLAFKMT